MNYLKKLIILFAFMNCACSANKHFFSVELPVKDELYFEQKLDNYGTYLDDIILATKSSKKNAIAVLNQGDDSLLARIELIRKAQKRIFVQTFIWESDESARFFAWELVQAAKRGVQVKILIDALNIPEDPRVLDLLLNQSKNLELKLYNPVAKNIKAPAMELLISAGVNFEKFNQRMHNKLFIVDNQIAIIGGRNYSNEYFDRGSERFFKDAEVIVVGSVVKEMVYSFSDYWFFKNVIAARDMNGSDKIALRDDLYKSREDLDLYALFDDLEKCLLNSPCTAKKFASRYMLVKSVEFIADKPEKIKKVGKQKTSYSQDKFYRFLSTAQKEILMRSPYLVVDRKGAKFFKKMRKLKPNLDIIVSSNSLAAADHPHAYAFAYKKMKKYLKKFKWKIFEFKPVPKDFSDMVSKVSHLTIDNPHKLTLHSKVYVVDEHSSWIGSYNLDPRSALLNTEASIIIDSERIAQLLTNDIKRDIAKGNSWVVAKRNKKLPVALMHGLMYDISKRLPFIDLWPYTYAGCFELEEGKEETSTDSADFYDNYRYLGPFPEVALTLIEVKARLTKAFLGSAEPLI